MYGVVMEKLFLIPGLKKEGFYLTLVQFIFYTIMAKFEMLHKRQKRRIPLKTYALLAGATLTTMSLSNASLGTDYSIIWKYVISFSWSHQTKI
jgi:hypothetical protein